MIIIVAPAAMSLFFLISSFIAFDITKIRKQNESPNFFEFIFYYLCKLLIINDINFILKIITKKFAGTNNSAYLCYNKTDKDMTTRFNNSFYTADRNYTREMAEQVMRDNGYNDFQFKSASFSNGASFYFDVDGREVRVSDHPLTGNRAFETVQLSLVKVQVMVSPLDVRKQYLDGEITKKEYRAICKEKGFIYKP